MSIDAEIAELEARLRALKRERRNQRIGAANSGKKHSAETRKRMSEAKKAAWADPEVRKRMSEATKAAWADPEVRKRMSEAKKAALAAKHEAAMQPRQVRRRGEKHELAVVDPLEAAIFGAAIDAARKEGEG